MSYSPKKVDLKKVEKKLRNTYGVNGLGLVYELCVAGIIMFAGGDIMQMHFNGYETNLSVIYMVLGALMAMFTLIVIVMNFFMHDDDLFKEPFEYNIHEHSLGLYGWNDIRYFVGHAMAFIAILLALSAWIPHHSPECTFEHEVNSSDIEALAERIPTGAYYIDSDGVRHDIKFEYSSK